MLTNRKKFTRSLLAAATCVTALTFGAPGMAAAQPAAGSTAGATNTTAHTGPRFSFADGDPVRHTTIGMGAPDAAHTESRFTFAAPTRNARDDASRLHASSRNATSGAVTADRDSEDGARSGQRLAADNPLR